MGGSNNLNRRDSLTAALAAAPSRRQPFVRPNRAGVTRILDHRGPVLPGEVSYARFRRSGRFPVYCHGLKRVCSESPSFSQTACRRPRTSPSGRRRTRFGICSHPLGG